MVHRELEQFVYAEITREPLLVAYGSRVQFRRVMPNLIGDAPVVHVAGVFGGPQPPIAVRVKERP